MSRADGLVFVKLALRCTVSRDCRLWFFAWYPVYLGQEAGCANLKALVKRKIFLLLGVRS